MNVQQRIQQAIGFHQAGRFAAAENAYTELLKARPRDAGLIHLLGVLKYQTGGLLQARTLIEKAISIDARHALMHFNLGKVYSDLGLFEEACASYREAIRIDPGSGAPYSNLAHNLGQLRRYPESVDTAREALQRNPKDVVAHQAIATGMRHMGDLEGARKHLAYAYALSGKAAFLFQEALLVPPVCDSVEEIAAVRAKVELDIGRLIDGNGRVEHPPTDVGMTMFYMSYHGLCNRDLMLRLADAHLKACHDLAYVAEHCAAYAGPGNRIRVGFLSAYMHHHSIGKTTRGLMARLDRSRFEVVALFLAPLVDDEVSRFIRDNADASRVVPLDLPAARKIVEECRLDILFYQDIGMEPFSYFLAFSRLAPVQCVSFGHPDTTGIPNMDWFVSSSLYEPPGAAAHYSERLFQLEQCGTLAYYYRPPMPSQPPAREAIGLPQGRNIYLCPQTLFKFHPDFDPLIAGILAADAAACLVIIEGSVKEWVKRFIARIRRLNPAVVDRILVLPPLPGDRFTALVAAADVMLDTIHFNGMNTSLEAFAVGTPVVTLPTALQRGRHTAGMYAAMGIHDAVASSPDEYVRIAVELGRNKAARDALSRRILTASHCLFENPHVVREFERFFEWAVEDVRNSGTPA